MAKERASDAQMQELAELKAERMRLEAEHVALLALKSEREHLEAERAALLAEKEATRKADEERAARLHTLLDGAKCPSCHTTKAQVATFGKCKHVVCFDCLSALMTHTLLMPRPHRTNIELSTVALRVEGELGAQGCPTCRQGTHRTHHSLASCCVLMWR